MAENQFVALFVEHVGYVEQLFLLSDAGIEHHVHDDIAQFLANLLWLVSHQCIAEFIHFLNGVRAQAFVRLLSVPRAFFSQCIEHVEQSAKSLQFFFFGMHVFDV